MSKLQWNISTYTALLILRFEVMNIPDHYYRHAVLPGLAMCSLYFGAFRHVGTAIPVRLFYLFKMVLPTYLLVCDLRAFYNE